MFFSWASEGYCNERDNLMGCVLVCVGARGMETNRVTEKVNESLSHHHWAGGAETGRREGKDWWLHEGGREGGAKRYNLHMI